MEELGSLWIRHENIDELKQKLLYTSIELESMKMEANESLKKHKEEVKQLLNLLQIAYHERDEAKDQLQKLVNKLMPSSPSDLQPILHHNIQNESPLVVIPTKANSSITESNSLTQSHGDSFFDAVSSPEFSNINMADSGNMGGFVSHNQAFVQDYSGSISTGLVSSGLVKPDPADAVLDSLIEGKILPQTGKFLQAVMDCAPILQTILVAGPLPRWRNPPPLLPFKIPPFSIKPSPNSSSSSSYLPVSRMCSTSMLNFSNSPSSSVHANGLLLTSGAGFNNQIPSAKRQRFH